MTWRRPQGPSCRCGLRSNLRQIRLTVDLLSPVRLAIEARDQCVSLPGVVSSVATTTSSTWSSRIDGGRPGRGSSCRPSSRRVTNRARQRSTVDSSTPRSADFPPEVQVARGDLRSPADMAEAVSGAGTVIHAATSPFRKAIGTELEGTRAVLAAAGRVGAHVIYPSIAGVDRLGGTYYRAKWQAEQLVASASHSTIQRATQLHPTLDKMLSHHLFPVTACLAFQPLDAGDLAERLVSLVKAGPAGRAEGMAAPSGAPSRSPRWPRAWPSPCRPGHPDRAPPQAEGKVVPARPATRSRPLPGPVPPSSPRSYAATGGSTTGCTGSATWTGTKTAPRSAPRPARASWRPCATWSSPSCGWPEPPASPPPCATTPGVPAGPCGRS